MITGDMREYKVYGTTSNNYGQSTPNTNNPIGRITMAVYITDFNTQRNEAFSSSSYVGLTEDLVFAKMNNGEEYRLEVGDHYISGEVDDRFELNRLLQINAIYHKGRYYQVFMSLSGYSADD